MSIKMTAKLYKVGTPLSDGNTIIDSSLMKQMVDDFNEHYKKDQFNYYHYGTINGKSFPNVNFEDITHKINSVYIKDGCIMTDIDILDAPKGNVVQKLLEHDNIRPSLDLIEHNGKIDIHSVSLNINNENYEN